MRKVRILSKNEGRALAQLLVAGFQPRQPRFEPRSVHVEFVVEKVALGQLFSEYFGFPCQFSFPLTAPHS
jgi:hypothetical protein